MKRNFRCKKSSLLDISILNMPTRIKFVESVQILRDKALNISIIINSESLCIFFWFRVRNPRANEVGLAHLEELRGKSLDAGEKNESF